MRTKIATTALRAPTRRDVLALALGSLTPVRAQLVETHQATGVKVGEVTSRSAILWARRTQQSMRRADGIVRKGNRGTTLPLDFDLARLEGSCPGEEGQLRALLWDSAGKLLRETDWAASSAGVDFTHQFPLHGLKPATQYSFAVETRPAGSRKTDGVLSGRFRTAPEPDALAPVDLAMMSCQKYSQTDAADGFLIYDAMRRFSPQFYLSVGDNVYYDSDDPVVNQVSVARYHWHRMYSMPKLVECLRVVPGYWIKDDHDCYSDDCWPGMIDEKMKPFRFEDGLKLFPEQVPFPRKPYRSFRWGRSLEIWLLEGRDFRSANPSPDGPSKSIWGAEQKAWLKASLAASDAHWKLIVSPTPIVGPDRLNKRDNHSNANFETEGGEFRKWLQENGKGNTFVLCGDRHWQYHSIDPATKVEEFGCGAASDSHASGTPGENPRYHRFHRVLGGFLAIQVRPEPRTSSLAIEHRDVNGKAVYSRTYRREAG